MAFDWSGAFENPLMKHRYHPRTKHPGHLIDHILIDSITMLTGDEIEAYDEDFENDLGFDLLLQLGDGGISWLVEMHWAGESETYHYVLNMDEADEEIAKKLIASHHS